VIRLSKYGQEVVSFWKSGISGHGFTPAIVESREPVTLTGDTPKYPEGEIYDVGAIVAAYQDEWLRKTPNHVTPAALRDLLFFLDELTQTIERKDLAIRTIDLGETEVVVQCDKLPDYAPGYAEPCVELQRWRARLEEYMLVLAEVPPEDDFERMAVLWNVTAPLFLGWYGGPSGHEVALVAGGFPPGFNPELQHRADIATPYILANQYGVADAWEVRRSDLLIDDLTPTIPPLPSSDDFKTALIYGAVALGSVLGLGLLLSRK